MVDDDDLEEGNVVIETNSDGLNSQESQNSDIKSNGDSDTPRASDSSDDRDEIVNDCKLQ